jgi:oligo-1,6-glucosidase
VINLISKPAGLPDGDLWALCANGPRVHEFLAEMHREVLAGRELLAVGETPGAGIDDARLYSDPARAEIDMVFTFEHVSLDGGASKWDLRPLRLTELKANLSAWQDGLADVGWNSLYWDNHDQPRIVSRWGDDGEHRVTSAKTLATVLHLLRGTPYVYQGEELGMTNAYFTQLDSYRDIESINWAKGAIAAGLTMPEVLHALAVKSRDNARTPMQWDASPQAGFTTGTPWLPVNPNHTEINAEAARKDPDSVFHHYRRLIEMRHVLPVVVHGDYRLLLPDDEQVFAYVRTLDGTKLTVLANLSGAAAGVPQLAGEVVISTHGRASPPSELAPWEGLAVLLRS